MVNILMESSLVKYQPICMGHLEVMNLRLYEINYIIRSNCIILSQIVRPIRRPSFADQIIGPISRVDF